MFIFESRLKAMRKITLTLKDKNKLSFLIELLKQFDFVEIQKENAAKKQTGHYDFFASAGLWKNRDISAGQLRNEAWKRNR